MKDDFKNFDKDDFEDMFDSPEKIERGEEYIEDGLWNKIERVGKKISFARDIAALYNYMISPRISWHRKAIVVGALVYFISPIDTIPDIAPLVGYLDDLGVVTAVLKFLGSELIPFYEKQ